MTPDYATILARLESLDEHVAKRLAGRLLRMQCAAEHGFLEAISATVASPESPLAPAWAELEPLRAEVLSARQRQRLLTPRTAPLGYRVYGPEAIHESARKQMEDVMRLAPVVAGALMPDAHVGRGERGHPLRRRRGYRLPYAPHRLPRAGGRSRTSARPAPRIDPQGDAFRSGSQAEGP